MRNHSKITTPVRTVLYLMLAALFVFCWSDVSHARKIEVEWGGNTTGTNWNNGIGGYVTPPGINNSGDNVVTEATTFVFKVYPDPSVAIQRITFRGSNVASDKISAAKTDATGDTYYDVTITVGSSDAENKDGNNNGFNVYFLLPPRIQVSWGVDTNGTNFTNDSGGYVEPPGIAGSGSTVYALGTTKVFKVYPAAGVTIQKITYRGIDITSTKGSAQTDATNGATYYNVTVTIGSGDALNSNDNNNGFNVYFKSPKYYVSVQWGIIGDGTGGEGGYVTPPGSGKNSTFVEFVGGANVTLTITVADGYKLNNVFLGRANDPGNTSSITFTPTATANEYTVTFRSTYSRDGRTYNANWDVWVQFALDPKNKVNATVYWGTDATGSNGLGGSATNTVTQNGTSIGNTEVIRLDKFAKNVEFRIQPGSTGTPTYHIAKVELYNLLTLDTITLLEADLQANGSNNYSLFLLDVGETDWNITVFFAANSTTYPVTVSIVPPADPATPVCPNTGSTVTPSGTVLVGAEGSQTFTLTPGSGCVVDSVLTDGLDSGTWTVNATTKIGSYTLYVGHNPHTVEVSFKLMTYPITVTAGANGIVSPGATTSSTTGTVNVNKNADQAFDITPNAGYRVLDVKISENGAAATSRGALTSYTFKNVTQAGSIAATFATEVVGTCTYCQTPAFISSGSATLLPNVLIIFDNSGSMANGAYSTVTHDWNRIYYGYFKNEKVYKQVNGVYEVDTTKADALPSQKNVMSGNYLNWKLMDKVDIVRLALIGGKVEGGMTSRKGTAVKYLLGNNNLKINIGTAEPTGIIQGLLTRVRFGVMFFGSTDSAGKYVSGRGGYLATNMGATETDLVTAIEGSGSNPGGTTPLAESLYEAVRFFEAKPSAFNYKNGTLVDYSASDPIQWACQKNFVLIVTDGLPNEAAALPGHGGSTIANVDTDFNAATWLSRIPAADRGTGENAQTSYLEAVAYYAHVTDLRKPTENGWFNNDVLGIQNLTIYGIYSFGATGGSQALKAAAKYGGFESQNGNDVSNQYPSPDLATEWDKDNNGMPDNYFEAGEGQSLDKAVMDAMTGILAKVSSGTAASILSNSEGSGANLLQAVFYPNKIWADKTQVDWTGEIQNLWYYVDPFIAKSSIREDTDFTTTTPDHLLDVKKDYTARFYFAESETSVELMKDTDGDGVGDVQMKAKESPDNVKSIWRAGKQLWLRDATDRVIHTSINGYSLLSPSGKGGFDTESTRVTALQPYLQAATANSNAEAVNIIEYIRGIDKTTIGYRPRTIAMATGGAQNVWKLGDIVTSTPRLQSSLKLNSYNLDSPVGYGDISYKYFVNSANYGNRGMVYVGANDGMLHAFKLGKLTVSGATDAKATASATSNVTIGGDIKATLTGTSLGEEQWAYIPRSALPYLKYNGDNAGYKHLFYVDGQTVLADVATGTCSSSTEYSTCPKDNSGGTNWRTVLIGSMGLGGATRAKNSSCSAGLSSSICVKTPISDPTDSAATEAAKTKMVGYSSYFALDITGQYYNSSGGLVNQPVLKWEFPPTDALDSFGLGYSTSGAAIVRISAKMTDPNDSTKTVPDVTKNGKWFAVFASGPTGPIDTTSHQFIGKSDQEMKFFVVDLGATIDATHPFTLNTNYWIIRSGVYNAFAGSMVNASIDTDRWDRSAPGNYQDDALYVGYVKANIADTATIDSATKWTDGGVVRLLTHESADPSTWSVSTVISGTGPVTGGIARLQDRKNKKLWLYFGSGRFYYGGDDPSNRRYIMGVQEGCYTATNTLKSTCSATDAPVLTLDSLEDQSTTIASALSSGKKGWKIQLDAEDTTAHMGAERSITDAVALTNGGVFFTTFKPTSDVCKFGGDSYLWGVKYDTGGTAPAAALTGKALVQVSTGAFEEVSLSTALTAVGNRKMGTAMVGKPPSDPPPIVTNAGNKPPKKILQILEK